MRFSPGFVHLSRAALACGLAGALLAFSGCLADIRPPELEERRNASDAQRARELLAESARALCLPGKSPEEWSRMSGVRQIVEDEWFGFVTAMLAPWPENPQRMRFAYVPFSDDSVVDFLNESGEATGLTWGVHDWNTWRREPGEERGEYIDGKSLRFALPTMQYFLEMPHRLAQPGDAAILDHAGRKEWRGKEYEVVYITWRQYEPHDLMDQYVAWLDAESGLLERVDFTVREQAPFVTASAFYAEFKEIDGFRVPTSIEIGSVGNPDDIIHAYRVSDIELNAALPRSEYALDPDRAPNSKR